MRSPGFILKPMEKIKLEKITIKAMVQLYCRHKHGGQELCGSCSKFLVYAHNRLDHCPYQNKKPTCASCPIHCYQKEQREKAREIMRFAGPRMIYRHPILALKHLWDSLVKPSRFTTKAK